MFMMGEDIGSFLAVVRLGMGLFEEFGPERIPTPLVGVGFRRRRDQGAALGGMRPIVEVIDGGQLQPLLVSRADRESSRSSLVRTCRRPVSERSGGHSR